MKKFSLLTIVLVLVLAALACDIPGLPSPGTPTDTLSLDEIVALTQTAAAGGGGGLPSDTPAGVPTDTPAGPQPLRVAYVDNGDLMLWTEGVGVTSLYTGDTVDAVRLSDDGQIAVFRTVDAVYYRPVGLYSIHTDGSGLQMLLDDATMDSFDVSGSASGAGPYEMEFIPGTHILAFNTNAWYEGPGLQIQDDYRQINVDTNTLSTVLMPGDGGMFYFSPDGNQAALVTPSNISLVNSDGTNRRDSVLAFTAVITYSEYQFYPIPLWAGDSSHLRVVIPSPDIIAQNAYFNVYDIPVDGSPATDLGSTAASTLISLQRQAISPNLNNVGFIRQDAPPSTGRQLHFVDLSTFGLTLYYSVPSDNLEFVNWSPDNSHFIFIVGDELKLGQLGGANGPLSDVTARSQAEWISDTQYVFTAGSYGSWQLRLGTISAASVLIAAPVADFVVFDFSN